MITIISVDLAFTILDTSILIQNSGKIAAILPLHTEGRYIKDAHGNVVILRGINAGGFLERPFGWWNPRGGGVYSGLSGWNPDAVKDNLDAFKMWGFNALRMHLNAEWWMTNPTSYNGYQMPQSFRDNIKDVIRWAGERGIYVILDFYSVQVGTGQDDLPFPPYCLDGSERFIPNIEAFVNFWRNVAYELKDFPNVLFELWNEPFWDSYNEETVAYDWFNAVNQTILAIREVTNHIIIVQWDRSSWVNLSHKPKNPPYDGSTLWWTQKYPIVNASNIIYSIHLYRPFARTGEGECYTYEDMLIGMTWLLGDNLKYYTKPIIVGEIGANSWYTGEELEKELKAFDNLLKICNMWNISYIIFCWRDTNTGIRYGVLKTTNYVPPPNRAGVIVINQTNIHPFVFSAGTSRYLYENNIAYFEGWFSENMTLKVTLKGEGFGYLNVFWKYYHTIAETKAKFSNGTWVNVENYFDATIGIISLPITFTDITETVIIYSNTES